MNRRKVLVVVLGSFAAVLGLSAILLGSGEPPRNYPAYFDTSKADTLSVEELSQRYQGVSLPTWTPSGIELCRIYDGGSFAMLVYSDRGETDYRKDNVTITLRSAGDNTIESLVERHPEGRAELSNGLTVFLTFWRDGERWPVSEGFPLQNGAVSYLRHNGIWYTVSGLSGHVSVPDMKRILESMEPIAATSPAS